MSKEKQKLVLVWRSSDFKETLPFSYVSLEAAIIDFMHLAREAKKDCEKVSEENRLKRERRYKTNTIEILEKESTYFNFGGNFFCIYDFIFEYQGILREEPPEILTLEEWFEKYSKE